MLDDLLEKDLEQQADIELKSEIPLLDYDTFSKVSSREKFSEIICEQPSGDEMLYDKIVVKLQKQNKQNKLIAIVGEAQIGKTHFLKRLLKDIKDRYNYVFYISLKSVNSADKMNILQFLTNQSSLPWINSEVDSDVQIFKKVVNKLNDPKQTSLCIVFDDFEKSNIVYKYFKKNLYNRIKVSHLFSSTLTQWFKQGQKIVLLSPWQFFQLSQEDELDSMRVIYLQGINHASQQNLLGYKTMCCSKDGCSLKNECSGKFFSENHEIKCSVCKHCFEKNCHYEICSFCYSPYNCMQLAQQIQNSNFQTLPLIDTIAAILIQKLISVFGKHLDLSPNFRFVTISRFAWEQYTKKVFIFSENVISSLNLSQMEISNLFSIRRDKSSFLLSTCPDLFFFFSHIFLQEFLAAAWLISCPLKELTSQLRQHRKSFLDGKFDVVVDFMYVISKNQQRKKWFSKISNENIEELQIFLG